MSSSADVTLHFPERSSSIRWMSSSWVSRPTRFRLRPERDPERLHVRHQALPDDHDRAAQRVARDHQIPSIRTHIPSTYTVGLSVLGYELVALRLCGETQLITEPFSPNPCEICGRVHRTIRRQPPMARGRGATEMTVPGAGGGRPEAPEPAIAAARDAGASAAVRAASHRCGIGPRGAMPGSAFSVLVEGAATEKRPRAAPRREPRRSVRAPRPARPLDAARALCGGRRPLATGPSRSSSRSNRSRACGRLRGGSRSTGHGRVRDRRDPGRPTRQPADRDPGPIQLLPVRRQWHRPRGLGRAHQGPSGGQRPRGRAARRPRRVAWRPRRRPRSRRGRLDRARRATDLSPRAALAGPRPSWPPLRRRLGGRRAPCADPGSTHPTPSRRLPEHARPSRDREVRRPPTSSASLSARRQGRRLLARDRAQDSAWTCWVPFSCPPRHAPVRAARSRRRAGPRSRSEA